MTQLTPRYKMHVRDLIAMTKEQVWLPFTEDRVSIVDLEFDNKEVIETNEWYNAICWYYLQTLTPFPEVTVTKDMHLGLRSTSSNVLMGILTAISTAVYDQAKDRHTERFCEYFGEIIYKRHNAMYNDCGTDTGMLGSYVDMSDIFDYCEVADIPELIELNKGILPNPTSIDSCTDKMGEIFMRYADAYSCASHYADNLYNRKQIGQIFGAVGYRNDVGGNIFSRPITTGILMGMRDTYDILIDSVTASIALLNTEEPLQASEYSNRRADLISMHIRSIEAGDCGNTDFTFIPKATVATLQPKVFYGLQIATNKGIFTCTHANAKELIKGDIRVRTVIGCKHPDPAKRCSTCYGSLGMQIPAYTNIGNVAQVCWGDKKTQTTMNYKHLAGSSNVSKISMGDEDLEIINPTPDNLALVFNPDLVKRIRNTKGAEFLIEVATKSLKNLGDINQNDIGTINVFNVSNLLKANFILNIPNQPPIKHSINLCFGSRESSFSRSALKHILKTNYRINARGQYVFDFTDYDMSKAVFKLPNKFDHTLVTIRACDQVWLGGNSDGREGGGSKGGAIKYFKGCKLVPIHKHPSKHHALLSLIEFLNSIYALHTTHVAVMLAAYLCKGNNDYRMATGDEPYVIGTYNNIMLKRSNGVAMAYQSQEALFIDPTRFLGHEVDPHPMDQMLRG
jgi:hypothetical protein